MRSNDQAGFISLLLLGIMLGSAVFITPTYLEHTRNAYYRGKRSDWIKLWDSRQALLSYTTLYYRLYGPYSVGPGHFPCPDRDSLHNEMEEPSYQDDGPNPPCGRTSKQVGNLPRHINFSTQKYAFHNEPNQYFQYRVDNHYVNNPQGRVVNTESLAGTHEVVYPILIGSRARSQWNARHSGQKTAISKNAILSALKPSIAAWIFDQISNSKIMQCMPPDSGALNEPGSSRYLVSVTIDNQHVNESRLCVSMINYWRQCLSRNANDDRAKAEQQWLLLLLAGKEISSVDCDEAMEYLTIEDIPLNQHWLVKNAWLNQIKIDRPPECRHGNLFRCALEYPSKLNNTNENPFIHLNWIYS